MNKCHKQEELILIKATLYAVRHEQRKTRASSIATRKQSKIDSKRASNETRKTRIYIVVSFLLGAFFEVLSIWSST